MEISPQLHNKVRLSCAFPSQVRLVRCLDKENDSEDIGYPESNRKSSRFQFHEVTLSPWPEAPRAEWTGNSMQMSCQDDEGKVAYSYVWEPYHTAGTERCVIDSTMPAS